MRESSRRAKEDCSDDHCCSSCYDHVLAAEFLTEEEVEKRSSRTTDVVDGGDNALEFGIRMVEVLGKLIVSPNEAAHDPLVIS